MLRITAPHFVAGIIPGVRAAPIRRGMIRWPKEAIVAYAKWRRWGVEEIGEPMAFKVNPANFNAEDNYRWDRPYFVGRQDGIVTAASEHVGAKSKKTTLKLTVGFKGPEGGVQVDAYIAPVGPKFRDALACFAPEYLSATKCEKCGAGGPDLEPAALIGRSGAVEVAEEFDEQSQSKRATLSAFYPTAGASAPTQAAPAAQAAHAPAATGKGLDF